MKLELSAKQVVEAAGCSLGSAYNYIRGDFPWPAPVAAAVEQATGISRLHLLYPSEYDKGGQPISQDTNNAAE